MIDELLKIPWFVWTAFLLGGGVTIAVLWLVLKILNAGFAVFRSAKIDGNGNSGGGYLSGIVTNLSQLNQSISAMTQEVSAQTVIMKSQDEKLSKIGTIDRRTKTTHELLMKAEQRQRRFYPKVLSKKG